MFRGTAGFFTQRQGLHAPGASGESNWFCNTIVFVQHCFAASHRPARSPPSRKPRSYRATAQSFPSRIPRKPHVSQGFPAPDSVSCGSNLRQPVCPPGLPGTGFCILRQLFAAALHARRGFPAPDSVSCGSYLRQPFTPVGAPEPDSVSRGSYLRQPFTPVGASRPRQNPLDEPACPPARTFANIANIIRMHERVLSDEKRRAKLSASDERGPCRGVS